MTPQAYAVAIQPAAFTHNMSNVIDSLKRLERIGSEESQTVQKILEAARELSETVGKYFPRTLQDRIMTAHVNDEGNICLGRWAPKPPRRVTDEDGKTRMEVPRPRYIFSAYRVDGNYGRPLLIQIVDEETFRSVFSERDAALLFSKDIANGLLEAINQFIENEHRASEEGLRIVASAAEGLKTLSSSSALSDEDVPF